MAPALPRSTRTLWWRTVLGVLLLISALCSTSSLTPSGTSPWAHPAPPALANAHLPAGGARPEPSIAPQPPPPLTVNILASPQNGTAPLLVSFVANVSGGVPPYSVAWTFGDASFGTNNRTNHTYNSAGNYSVIVQVHDVGNQSATANTTIVVHARGAPLSATAQAAPSLGRAPLRTTLWANASGGRAPYAVSWNFGDGGNGTGNPITHGYRSSGNFTAAATVRDAANSEVAAAVVVHVSPSAPGGTPPQLTLVPSPAQGNAPLATNVSATVAGGKAPFNLTVCVGSGVTCASGPPMWSGASPVLFPYTFRSPGSYTITGTLRDANGNTTTSSAAVRVTVAAPLVVSVSTNRSIGPIPLSIGFVATVSGGTPPYALEWNFGDGTVGTAVAGLPAEHLFRVAGTFVAQLVVTDSAGHRAMQSAASVDAIAPRPVHQSVYATTTVWEWATTLVVAIAVVAYFAARRLRRWRDDRLRRQGEALVEDLQQDGAVDQR